MKEKLICAVACVGQATVRVSQSGVGQEEHICNEITLFQALRQGMIDYKCILEGFVDIQQMVPLNSTSDSLLLNRNTTDRETKFSVICEDMHSGLTMLCQERVLPHVLCNCVKISAHFSAAVAEGKIRRNMVKETNCSHGLRKISFLR